MTRLQANALLMIAALLWGGGNVAQKTILDDLGPFASVGLRCLIGVLVIAPLALREARRSRPMTRAGRHAILRASVLFCLALTCQQISYGGTSVTNASFLVNTTVVFTPLFAWLMLKERPHVMTWPCIALVLIGIFLMGQVWSGLGAGDAFCLVSAVLYSVWIVLVAQAGRTQDRPFALAAWQFGLTAIVGIAVSGACEPVSLNALAGAGPELAILGVLSTAVSFTLQAIAQAFTSASDAAVVMSAESLFGAVTAALWLDERMSVSAGLGGVLILVAVLLVQRPVPAAASLRHRA